MKLITYDSSCTASLAVIALVSLLASSTISFAAPVAPPRPAASERVIIQPGQSNVEKSRMERAHHNKTHVKKDKTKED